MIIDIREARIAAKMNAMADMYGPPYHADEMEYDRKEAERQVAVEDQRACRAFNKRHAHRVDAQQMEG
jgi:hypothetical protein